MAQTTSTVGTISAASTTAKIATPAGVQGSLLVVSSSSVTTGATLLVEGRNDDPITPSSLRGKWRPLYTLAVTANGAKAIPLRLLPDITRLPDYVRVNAAPAPAITHATTTGGDGSHEEVQTIKIAGASYGTFTLTYSGQTTAAITYDSEPPTAAFVKAALEDLSNIAVDDFTVTLSVDTYTLTTTAGGAFHFTNIAQLTSSATNLVGNTGGAWTDGTHVVTLVSGTP